MRIPKKYGESKIDKCPFCNNIAVTESLEGVPVCTKHKEGKLPDLKCVCGEYVDLRKGNFGPYFSCLRCGNVNFKRILDVNPSFDEKIGKESNECKSVQKTECGTVKQKTDSNNSEEKREITVTSDELDFL
jgi:hypothetical protein